MRTVAIKSWMLLSLLGALNGNAQLLMGLDKAIANKVAFKNAVKHVEETQNRFFYKKSNSGYIFTGTDSDLDGDHKSYMDIRFSGDHDTIYAQVLTYQMSSETYVPSETIHGKNGKGRTIYKHLSGDIYVALEDMDTGISGAIVLKTYLLYNPDRGVYFHKFIYRQERKNLNTVQNNYWYVANGQVNTISVTTQLGEKYYYVNGSGLYKKSKKDQLTEQELEISKDPSAYFDSLLIEAYKQK
jgi:hypothetical protein